MISKANPLPIKAGCDFFCEGRAELFLFIGGDPTKIGATDPLSGQEHYCQYALMISVPLLGTYGLSTLMKFGLFGAWFTILWLTMTKWKFSLLTKIILCVAQVYYVFWLVHFPNNAYTNDLPEHIAYLQHLAFNWKDLFGYGGYERFHPVTYYFLAGLIYKGALLFSQIDPL